MFWKFSLLLPLCLTLGCGLFQLDSSNGELQGSPKGKVFYAKFDHVWRATHLAMQKYPIQSSNMDKGLLETVQIKGSEGWAAPHQGNKTRNGLSYRLQVRIVEGHIKGHVATKVTIYKVITLQRDFFASPEILPSDGLEETTLLYRIGRELQIDKALERFQRTSS